MKRNTLLIGLIVALMAGLSAPPVSAEEVKSGFRRTASTGFGFLLVGQSARATAMGEAYIPIANDINAIFWNPAGLVAIERGAFSATYTRWLVNSKLYSGAVSYNIPFGTLGVSVISFAPEQFEETTIFEPQGTGEMVNGNGTALGLVFAKRLTNKLSFGLEVRYLQQNLHREQITHIDFGVSSMFATGFASSRIGMSLKNFGADKAVVTDDPFRMPMVFNFGAAMEVIGNLGDPVSLTLSLVNAYNLEVEKEQFRIGTELWLQNMLALRAGYKFDKGLFGFNRDIYSWSIGAGVKQSIAGRSLAVDFSYAAVDEVAFSAPLRLTLSGTF